MSKILLSLILILSALTSPAQSIYNSGANIVSQAGTYWVVEVGTIRNDGVFTADPGSTVILNGTSAQTIGGSNPTAFGHLILNNGLGISLLKNISVAGSLDFQNGMLTTGNNTLTMGASGTFLNANSSKFVDGKLALTFASLGSKVFPLGKNGIFRPITFQYTGLTGTSVVTAEQFESPLTGTLPASTTLMTASRYWDIGQAGGTDLQYLLTLDATGYEPSGNVVLLKKDAGSIASYATTSPDYTNAVALTSFSEFALGNLCANPVNGGIIAGNQISCTGFDPAEIASVELPSGQFGTLEYKWQSSTDNITFSDITAGSYTSANYNPDPITVTTWFKRLARVTCMSGWAGAAESNVVKMTVNPLPAAPLAGNISAIYDGLSHTGSATPPAGSTVIWYTASSGGSVTAAPAGIPAGTYTAWAGSVSTTTGCSSATRTQVTVTINRALLSVTARHAGKVYNGLAYSGGNGITCLGLVNGETIASLGGSLTYRGSSQGAIVVGNYVITPAGLTSSNYTISFINGTLTINPMTIAVYAAPLQSKVYGSADPVLGYTVNPALLVGDRFTGALSRVPGENAGSYPITIGTLTAGSNYRLTMVSRSFTIIAKGITVMVNPGQFKTYGTTDPEFTFSVAPELVAGDRFSGVLARAAGESVAGGPYAIGRGTLTASANYTISFVPATFVITPKPVSVTVITGQTKVYGSADPVFAYSFAPSLIGTDTFTGALSRETGKNVGPYAITIGTLAAGTNYDIAFFPASFSITAKPITVMPVAATKLYDGSRSCAVLPIISPALIAGDTPGFIQLYDNKMAGTDKTLLTSGSVNDGNGGKNYLITFSHVLTGVIDPKALIGTITAEDKEYDGNTSAVILIRSLTGVINGDVVSYVGGTANFDTPDVGLNKSVTATGLSLSGPDAPNYTVNTTAYARAGITGAIIVSTSVMATPGSIQYSDKVVLTATINGGAPVFNTLTAAKSATFTIGGQIMKDAFNNTSIPFVRSGNNLVAILTTTLTETLAGAMSPGEKPVTATFNEVDINFHVLPNPVTTSLVITQEDARTTYTGDLLVPVTPGGKTTVLLSASVRDITSEPGGDSFAGEISKATVSFVNRKTNTVLGTAPVTLVNPLDIKSGTAVLNWTNVQHGDYLIGMVVNNCYTRDAASENTVVEVYEATGDYITGGGSVIPTQPSGRYAPDNGKTINFGFNVKFDEQGTILNGRSTLILRRSVNGFLKVYQVGSTSITDVAVNIDNSLSQTGGFIGVANLSDITNPLLPVEVAKNLNLKINLTDRGIPGTNDGIAITLWSGAILYCSANWVANKSAELNPANGNVIINSAFNINNELVTGIGEISLNTAPGVEIMAYPNPSPGMVNFSLKLDESSKTTLDILTMNGTLVDRVFDGFIDHSMAKIIHYDSKLPQGVYLYLLKTTKQILYGKIVITKEY